MLLILITISTERFRLSHHYLKFLDKILDNGKVSGVKAFHSTQWGNIQLTNIDEENNNDDDISDEDKQLFAESMRFVKPLAANTRIHITNRVNKRDITKQQNKGRHGEDKQTSEHILPTCHFSVSALPTPKSATDKLWFKRSGVRDKTMKQLMQGKVIRQDLLDLHGASLPMAENALEDFFQQAIVQRYNCVLIVHGKSGRTPKAIPILKNYLDVLLPQISIVLAYCSARQDEGGTGAIYVLLKV